MNENVKRTLLVGCAVSNDDDVVADAISIAANLAKLPKPLTSAFLESSRVQYQ